MSKNIKSLLGITQASYLVSYLFIAATVLVILINQNIFKARVEFSVRTTRAELIQVFCDQGSGFSEKQARSFITGHPSLSEESFTVFLPGNCNRLRFDLGSNGTILSLLHAKLKSGYGLERDLSSEISAGNLNDVHLNKDATFGVMTFVAAGEDPNVVLNGNFKNWTRHDIATSTLRLTVLFFLIFSCLLAFHYLHKNNGTLFLILVVAIFFRLAFFFGNNLPVSPNQLTTYWHDESTYYSYAARLLEKGIQQYFFSPTSVEVAPGNIFYLASTLTLFDGNLTFIRLFNLVVLTTLIIVCVFESATRLFSYKVGVGAGIILAIYPEFIAFAPALLTEYLFITLAMIFVVAIFRISYESQTNNSTPKIILWVLVGSLAGIGASITRLVFLPVLALVFCYALYLYFKEGRKKNALIILSVLFLTLVGLSPFFQNGHRHSGNYMIATGSGAALWLGSRHDTEGDEPGYRGKNYDTARITNGLSHLTLEGDRSLKSAAIENIKSAPIDYMWWGVKKIGRLTIGNNYSWFHPATNFSAWIKNKTKSEVFTRSFSLFLAAIIAPVWVTFPLIWRQQQHEALLIYLIGLALIAIYLPFLVNQRYGLPVFVLGSILFTHTIHQAWASQRRLVIYLHIFLGSVASLFIALGV
jgi:hypothetical protein